MTSQKQRGPGAADTARGAHGRLAHAGSRAGGHYTKQPAVDYSQKLQAVFEPCREAQDSARRRDEQMLRAARLVAEDLGFSEVGPGWFEAKCPECESYVGFDCKGRVEDNPRGSCGATSAIRDRVAKALKAGGAA
jgi:hypothetical protein